MKKREHKRILTLDQGNSSAKAVVWADGEPVDMMRMSDLTVESLLPLLERSGIDGCVYSSVIHTDAKFLESLRLLMDGSILILTPATPLPIGVDYSSRNTLGNDRVAAAVGAAKLFPGVASLIVDSGTAVTMDVIDSQGIFRGGNIAPGMSLRFRSLHEATDKLPLLEPSQDFPEFGKDTQSAIRSGVIGGMIAEVVTTYHKARHRYGCERVILTGSDSHILVPSLLEEKLPLREEPNLVGLGLLSIYLYNNQNQ